MIKRPDKSDKDYVTKLENYCNEIESLLVNIIANQETCSKSLNANDCYKFNSCNECVRLHSDEYISGELDISCLDEA